MWNKQTQQHDEPAARPTPEPIRPVPTHTPPAPRPEPARQPAAIGAAMNIKGEIHAREQLTVDGEVEGILQSESQLTIGPSGKVRANIKAREVIIFGSVRGNVEVVEKIAIREQGSLVGDIKAAGISIDDGAYFKGSIDIVRPEPKISTRPVKNEAKVEAAVG
ncbi:MAG: polymer-forming cytoskeletal protein [Bryobacteraceae bacterium]